MISPVAERRLGRFKVGDGFLKNSSAAELNAVFSSVVVLYVKAHEDSREYIAAGSHFDVVEDGVSIPEYEAVVRTAPENNYVPVANWKKVKK